MALRVHSLVDSDVEHVSRVGNASPRYTLLIPLVPGGDEVEILVDATVGSVAHVASGQFQQMASAALATDITIVIIVIIAIRVIIVIIVMI